jgi:hypothetical protein
MKAIIAMVHCFAFSYEDLKLGKLVGMPCSGTCTFAGWETLQDNSMFWGVPPMGVKSIYNRWLFRKSSNRART